MDNKTESRILPHNFQAGNLTQDLMLSMFRLCGSGDSQKKTNFPKNLYHTYVSNLHQAAIDINRKILLANESHDKDVRMQIIDETLGLIKHLDDLLYTAYQAGWISKKQYGGDNGGRAKLISDTYWKVFAWRNQQMKT